MRALQVPHVSRGPQCSRLHQQRRHGVCKAIQLEAAVTETSLGDFRVQVPVSQGPTAGRTLVVEPMTDNMVPEAAELLAEVFAESKGYGMYKAFLKRQVQNYLRTRVGPTGFTALGKSVVLVAYLQDEHDPSEDSLSHGSEASASHTGVGSSPDCLPSTSSSFVCSEASTSGSGSVESASPSVSTSSGHSKKKQQCQGQRQLLAAAEVSFDPVTRSSQPWLMEPPTCAYLSNMAVKPSARRAGLGLLMVSSAEQVAQSMGRSEMYLHLRFKDAPAKALYAKAGFSSAAEHPPYVFLLGWDRMYLMRKALG